MTFRHILKNRLLNLFFKPACVKENLLLIRRYPEYKYTRTVSAFSRYFSFAFLNFLHFAKAENEDVSCHPNKDCKTISIEAAISQSDEFFSVGNFQESAKVLEPFQDSGNVEVLWRISRALYNMSKQKGINSSENASLVNKAYDYIKLALTLEKNHYAVHKWMAVLYDAKSALEGIKARINALPVFKEHLMTAIKLNPKDATSIHMLGLYMYNIADMSWSQKTVAKTFFGCLPEATFEEAFYYFSKAEEVEPNFYSANLLMLGKTCLKLKKIEAGCYWLKCATNYPVRTDEDEAVRLEAEELLQKYPGVKLPSKEEKNQQDNSK